MLWAYLIAELVQQGDDALLDLLQGEGLGKEALRARRHGLEHPGIAGVGGDQEQWDCGGKILLLFAQHEIETVHMRHIQVAEDETERLAGGNGVLQRIQTLPAIGGVDDLYKIGNGEP